MKQLLNPGKYIVAVSGGVDSVVLLNMLSNLPKIEIVVAHFDHGIRKSSETDRKFVGKLSKQYGIRFEYAEGHLGKNTSEDLARKARYKFLEAAMNKHDAEAMVTAHHQDDVIETMIINILRGTKRKGLSSLKSTEKVIRPLLNMTKADILDYARKHKLQWREDETNQDEKYLRNWVRKNVVGKLSTEQRKKFIEIYKNSERTNTEIDSILNELHYEKDNQLDRKLLRGLGHKEAKELVAHWLRLNEIRDFSAKQLEAIVVNAKVLKSGKTSSINKNNNIKYSKDFLELTKV